MGLGLPNDHTTGKLKSASIDKTAQSFSNFITPAHFSNIQVSLISQQASRLAPAAANPVISAWILLK